MRVVRIFLVGLIAAMATALSGCTTLDSFDDQGGQPLSSLFQQHNDRGSRSGESGALQPTRYVSANGTTAIVEPGDSSQASFDQTSEDPELAKVRVTLSFVDTDVREFAKVLFSQLLKR